jgi:hypothetical protein
MKWLSLGLVFGFVATGCSDGYPSKGEVLSLHFQMTQQQAVDALNTIGSRPHLKHEWRYSVTDSCGLEVSVHGSVLRQKNAPTGLLGAEISLVKLDKGESFAVILEPPNSEPSVQVTVMAGGTWSDASQVKWLLDYLPKFCSSAAV